MVEVMVTFANGHKRGGEVVSWCVLVVKWSLSQPVGEGIDAEGRLLKK